ncbi:hypothetical protein [Acidianus bottle-shaped virus 3 strain ABV3]|uniref:Uncharacterized protein n=1 Tax=Acidianus bottle-shaped virus 3 strain ABV3 TaxID=1732174 RepID=A0A0N7FYX4_9VIRU|nr:hypothetical protein AVU00_gp26 [Acidianus bottle-shaped virus 3 strain ABV3]ALG96828.1 hypothetical protein [Acidianus bottle-shaped virus 3 strain ABV3]
MFTLDELFNLAQKDQFNYLLVFFTENGEIYDALAFDLLQPLLIEIINNYLSLVEKLNEKIVVKFYKVSTRQEVKITQIPIYIPNDSTSQTQMRRGYL